MVETNRRKLLKTFSTLGIATTIAGCNDTGTEAENTQTQTHSNTAKTTRDTTTTTTTQETTKTATETRTETDTWTTTQTENKEYQNIRQKARETVAHIRKVSNEGLSESTIYMGNVNSYDFSTISLHSLKISKSEEILGKSLPEKLERMEQEKLIKSAIGNRMNKELKYEYISVNPRVDNIEPNLLLNSRLNIDIIPLTETEISLKKLKKSLIDSLDPVLGSSFDLNVEVKRVAKNGDSTETFVQTQKNYAQDKPGTLQLYLTQKVLGDTAGIGLRGYAPIDGNTAVIRSKVNELFGYNEMDVIESATHEVGHSAFDIQHSASQDDVMLYTDVDDLKFGKRSKYLIQRYLNSSLETEIRRDDESGTILMGFKPSKIDANAAKTEFLDHLETYLRDIEGFEDIENWEFEYEGQTSMGDDKATATRQFDTGEILEIDFLIRYFIDDISLHTSS